MRLAGAALLLTLVGAANALADRLFVSRVGYCSNQSVLLVNKLYMSYYRSSRSMAFDLDVQTARSDINATIELSLDAYGLVNLNVTKNLCELSVAFCPLPSYELAGAAMIELPDDMSSRIPTAAFVLPDLAIDGQIRIFDSDRSDVGCLKITLTNGITFRQPAIAWTAGFLTVFAYATTLAHSSFWPLSRDRSAPEVRFASWVHALVWIAYTGIISVDNSASLAAWSRNFGFIVGLINWSAVESIERFVRGAGGYNVVANSTELFYPLDATTANRSFFDAALAQADTSNQMPSFDSKLQADAPLGMGTYVQSLGIDPSIAFMLALVSWMMVIAISSTVSLLAFFIIKAVIRRQQGEKGADWRDEVMHRWRSFAVSNGLRILLVTYFPFTIMDVYQWRIGMASGAAATIFFALTTTALGLVCFALWRLGRRAEAAYDMRKDEERVARRWAILYDHRRLQFYDLTGPLLAIEIIKALLISAFQGLPWVQCMGLGMLDLACAVGIIRFRPYAQSGTQALHVTLATLRAVTAFVMIVFIPGLEISKLATCVVLCARTHARRTVVGLIIAVAQMTLLVFLALLVIGKFVLGVRWAIVSHDRGVGPRSGFLGSGYVPLNTTSGDSVDSEKLPAEKSALPSRPTPLSSSSWTVVKKDESSGEVAAAEKSSTRSQLGSTLFASKFATSALSSIGRKPSQPAKSESTAATQEPVKSSGRSTSIPTILQAGATPKTMQSSSSTTVIEQSTPVPAVQPVAAARVPTILQAGVFAKPQAAKLEAVASPNPLALSPGPDLRADRSSIELQPSTPLTPALQVEAASADSKPMSPPTRLPSGRTV